MKILDLFSGIGGFTLAAERVYGKVEGGYSEIDKYAKQIYKKHFPEHIDYGDITTIRERDLPYFDIITFGFPCQDLSIAGKRKGFGGHRSSLFHEAIRIINAVRPKYFIFENVKGLYSSHGGRDFTTVLRTITDIGYDGQWQLINTKWFLPQNRERIFFVGHLRGQPRPEVFPIGETSKYVPGIRQESEREGKRLCFSAITSRAGNRVDDNFVELKQVGSLPGYDSNRIYDSRGIAKTITGGSMSGGEKGQRTGLYMIPRGNNPGSFNEEFCPSISTSSFEHNALLQHKANIRRLTPIECERLQGFPDNWTEGISDTQRYKCLGNAITVNVAEEIFKRL